MFLRCVHCGKRSSGWEVTAKPATAAQRAPIAHTHVAQARTAVVPTAPPPADDPLVRAFVPPRLTRPTEVDTARTARSQYTAVPVLRITKEDLKQRLESGTPPIVIDARLK